MGVLNSLFQVALHLPSYRCAATVTVNGLVGEYIPQNNVEIVFTTPLNPKP